jgi:hypothetical protein
MMVNLKACCYVCWNFPDQAAIWSACRANFEDFELVDFWFFGDELDVRFRGRIGLALLLGRCRFVGNFGERCLDCGDLFGGCGFGHRVSVNKKRGALPPSL